MDGLGDFFGNNWQKLLTGGLFATGEVGNILQGQKQSAYQNFLLNLLKNPAQFAALINQATTPLSTALVQGITNQVQGNLATRGLSQAPGIFAATESQALAPAVLSSQQSAEQAVLRLLGLPGEVSGLNKPPANLTPLLQLLLKSFNNPQGGGLTLPSKTSPIDIPSPPIGLTLPTTGSDTGGGTFDFLGGS